MVRKRRRRHKIVWTILAVLLVVSLIPMGLLGWWLIQPIRDEVSTKEREIQLEKARQIAGDVETYVRAQRTTLETSATGLALLLENAGTDQFTDMIQHYDLLSRYLDPNRQLYGLQLDVMSRSFSTLRLPGLFEDPWVERSVDLARESALSGRPFYYSQPFLLSSPAEPVMLVSVPLVVGERQVIGALSGVISLRPLLDWVVHDYGSGSYTVYVLDRNHQLVAHSNFQKVLRGEDMSQVDLVQRRYQDKVAVGTTYEFTLDGEGSERSMLGAFYPVNGLDWTIFIQSDMRDAYSTVRAMMRTLAVSLLGAFLIAILAAVYFAESLSWPIRLLATKTRSLAQGDFSQRVEVRSRNELGELADTFNFMSEQMESYIGRLQYALERNKELFLGCVRTMAAAIDEKDPYTRGHSERVDRYSLIIGRKMGLGEEDMHRLHIGALLHDVGKIGIDDRILKKPSALSPEEFETMKQHPTKGANIIEPIEALADVLPIIQFHHERYDGKGYPDGLSGEEIPLLARIVTVADTFDAMTTDRPYQRAMTYQVALSKIVEFKGKACDPVVVDAFVRAFRDGDLEDERRPEEERRIRALEQLQPFAPPKVAEMA